MAAAAAKVVKEGLYWVGVFDPNLRVFDIIMRTPYGTSYNSYLLKGARANVLFETAKAEFWAEYEARLGSVLGPGETVDYIVLNHTEPDHSGSLARLLRRFPHATVVATNPALRNLARIAHADFAAMAITPGCTTAIDVGGYTVRFVVSPLLHWPDTMFSIVPELNTAITCDFFGAHYCNEKVFSDLMTTPQELHDVPDAYKYYFDCIFGPFKPHVLRGLQNLAATGVDIDTICCSHGPVLRGKDAVARFSALYSEWAQPEKLEDRVVIAYVSAYGFTRTLAAKIAEALAAAGVKADLFDLVEKSVDDAVACFEAGAKGLLLGTPTIVGEALPPILEITTRLNPIIHRERIFGTFGSFGWSGEGCRNIQQRLDQLRARVPLEPFTVVFKPTEEELKSVVEWATNFARAVKGEKVDMRKSKQAPAPAAAAAPKKASEPVEITFKNVPKDGRRRLWKCIVCGEVIPGVLPPQECPVCGAGIEAFVCVGVAEDESAAQSGPKNAYAGKVVIIGAGGAGVSAVKAIREVNTACSVTVVASEAELPYYRTAIPKLLGKPDMREGPSFRLYGKEWYESNNVQLLLGSTVTKIDAAAHVLTIEKAGAAASQLPYDRLIIATGGTNLAPRIEGLPQHCSNVFGVRVAADIDAISAAISANPAAARVVIIGGGLTALETASALRSRGVTQISLVELLPRILPRQLSEEASEVYQNAVTRAGITLHLGCTCTKAELGPDGRLAALELSNGKKIECDLLCIGIGTVAETSLGRAAGCAMGARAITVDTKMHTSVPDILACGDCVEVDKRFVPTWNEASSQGRVAGLRAIDDPSAEFARVPNPYYLEAFLETLSIGTIDSDGERLILSRKASPNDYAEYFMSKEMKLVGAILMGDCVRRLQVDITAAINAGASRAQLFEIISKH